MWEIVNLGGEANRYKHASADKKVHKLFCTAGSKVRSSSRRKSHFMALTHHCEQLIERRLTNKHRSVCTSVTPETCDDVTLMRQKCVRK